MKRKSDRQTNTNSHHTQQKHITQNNKHLFLRQFACNAMQRRENKKKNKKRKTITTTLMINEQIIENETGTNEDRTAVIRWRLAHGMYCTAILAHRQMRESRECARRLDNECSTDARLVC